MSHECKPYVDYASFPNPALGQMNASDYEMLAANVTAAAANCTDAEAIYWGACNIVYPKCLLGSTLQLCRQTCYGKDGRAWPTIWWYVARPWRVS